ncbi:transmembrane and coiled-coil domains protein 1-like [Micropterus dolomieu]|uniref:transmembrane and coiled-coil domains protein 1-like n=1 Tax=Micropterus dolomieu TaxID=147949 RepID=UPI001E8D777E|nr:transmembrane and coiled-coil domains protein 1-like [Micropterus dolomieu]
MLLKYDRRPADWNSLKYTTSGLELPTQFSGATYRAAGVQAEQNLVPHLQRFGSTDNIAALIDLDGAHGGEGSGPGGTRTLGTGQLQSSLKYSSDNYSVSATSGSAGASGQPPGSKGNTIDYMQRSGFDAILHEIQELQENQGRLEERFENLKSYHQEYTVVVEALEEERYRCERLEEQLNDLTELHQNEILNLKEELASMDEKIAYQSFDRATDIHEVLEACQTHLFKIEQQQQQEVQLEVLEKFTAQTLLGKLISVLLAIMAVLLVFVSMVANCVVPLMKTYSHMLTMLLFVLLCCFLWRHWDALLEYLHYSVCTHHPEKK